ncbi:MAG: ATP-binding protein, partial [Chloroflexi bacterium]|nr:ATP-binding protein [Chloroflexota bacterium]
MSEDTPQSGKNLNIGVDGDADIKNSAFGDENQLAGDIGNIGGHLVQAQDSDVHISNDRNVNILGNLVIYLSSRPEEADPQPASAKVGPNPYKGLSAFSETDAGRFFGREILIRQLWEKYRDLHEMSPTPRAGGAGLRLLAILGPSGSGKSSVARAGLLPELARRPLPGKKRARVAVLTPGSHPLRALAAILARIATNDPSPVAKSREFEGELRQTPPCPPQGGNEAFPGEEQSPLEGGRGVSDGAQG